MRFKAYLIAFVAVFLILIAANYYSYVQMGRGFCDDCFLHFGWPFPLWEEGGFVTVKRVLWAGLVANVSIAIWIGLFFGWVSSKLLARQTVRSSDAA
jgi:formate hydrogenlyase subunit 3/multisubunit Na+/H+ antiporter MnhD subunit